MTEQLALIDLPAHPKLTDRQQAVLAALTTAGIDGLDADQAGAIAHGLKEGQWAHGPDQRCTFCGRDGQTILKRLRDLGLARYRRGKGALAGCWLADGTATPMPRGMTDVIPY